MDALVLGHDCFKIDQDSHILSAAAKIAHGLWFLAKSYADIRRGLLVKWCQMRVWSINENASFLCRWLDLPYEVPHWLYIIIKIYTASRGFPATARLCHFCVMTVLNIDNF